MLNEVVIEGYISGTPWTYSGEQFFRVGSYRDRQRPAKRSENRDEPDYVTARLESGGLPVMLQGGTLVRVHGYFQSRYYSESMADWLKDAKGPTHTLSIGDEARSTVTHNRVVTEIVVEKLVVLSPQKSDRVKNGREPKAAKKPATVAEDTASP